MIYQIDGKIVKGIPKGKFIRVVEIKNKLMNFITKETKPDYIDFWINNAHIAVDKNLNVHINGKEL